MHCEVLRPFQATNDETLTIGQIVETTGWREESVLRLIAQRYLREVPLVAESEPVPDDEKLWQCEECGEQLRAQFRGLHRAKKHPAGVHA